MRVAIGAAIIRKGSLLLVRKKTSWILPGGKIEGGEGDLECLSREVGEELSGTRICDEIFYGTFSGRTPHKGDIPEARVYLANVAGKIYGVRDGDSISKAEWVSDFRNYNLSYITSKIVDALKSDEYLE